MEIIKTYVVYILHGTLLHVGFEVLTAVNMKTVVFWIGSPDDGGSTDLCNVGKLIPVYTALQPRTHHLNFYRQTITNMAKMRNFDVTRQI
jgi:hypothetical protein